jgi:hypothetical protein
MVKNKESQDESYTRLMYKKTNDIGHFQIEICGEHVERTIHNMDEIGS